MGLRAIDGPTYDRQMALVTSLGGRCLLPALALAASLIAAVPAAGAATAKPEAGSLRPPATIGPTAPATRTPRIIGGTAVPDGGWPWIVSIRRSGESANRCGGTVIAADLILTAAHCVHENGGPMPASSLYVVAKQRQLQPITGEVLQVAKIVVHPAWENKTYGGDAALLFLTSNTTAPAIRMADLAFEASALTNSAVDWAAGWGSTAVWRRVGEQPPIDSPVYPNDLMQAQLNLYAPGACNAILPQTPAFWTDWHLCAGAPPTTTCNGDSGGPHIVQSATGEWLQVGITSIGWLVKYTDGSTGYCTTYDGITRVAAIANWAIATWTAYHATPAPTPKPRDVQAPVLTLKSQRAPKRRAFRVYYRVRDNLGETADQLLIKLHGRVVVRRSTAFGEAKNKLYFFRVSSKLRRGTYRLEVRSRDRAGNVSRTAVAKLRVR